MTIKSERLLHAGIGERRGLGYLIASYAYRFDMLGLAAMFVLIVIPTILFGAILQWF
jgi:hypothetical protein